MLIKSFDNRNHFLCNFTVFVKKSKLVARHNRSPRSFLGAEMTFVSKNLRNVLIFPYSYSVQNFRHVNVEEWLIFFFKRIFCFFNKIASLSLF